MRLIDADTLKEPIIKLLETAVERVEFTSVSDHCHQIYVAKENELTMFIDLINNAPTVERPIRCKDCKHQTKDWHEDKRMKEGGYWVYGCDFIADPFVSASVSGEPEEYCSSAEQKGGAE